MKPLWPLLVVVATALALATGPSPASAAAKPCWRQVLQDWTNGGIQARYRASCYAEALQNLPTDVRLYSDAGDEIRRAMLSVLREGPTSGGGAGQGRAAEPRSLETLTPQEADRGARKLPLPILAALTLALTLLAAGVVGRLRSRRVAARSAHPPTPDLR